MRQTNPGTGGGSTTPSAPVMPVGISVPPGWGQNWLAKLAAAKAGTGKAKVSILVDSLGTGNYADSLKNGFGQLTGSGLRGANGGAGDGGSGFNGAGNSPTWYNKILVPAVGTYYAGQGDLWTVNGTWATILPTDTANYFADGPGAISLSTAVNGNSVVIPGRCKAGGTITVYGIATTIAQQVTVGVNGATSGANFVAQAIGGANAIWTATISPTVDATSVTVTAVAVGSGSIFVSGAAFENPTGVCCDLYGHPSALMWQFNNAVGVQNTQTGNAIVTPAGSGGYGPAGFYSGGKSRPADLNVVALTANDMGQGRFTSYVAHDLALYLWDVCNQATRPDVLIVAPHYSYLGSTTNQKLKAGLEYSQQLRQTALACGAAYVDLYAIGKNSYPWLLAQGYLAKLNQPGTVGTTAYPGGDADPAHLSNAGHAWVATQILAVATGAYAY